MGFRDSDGLQNPALGKAAIRYATYFRTYLEKITHGKRKILYRKYRTDKRK